MKKTQNQMLMEAFKAGRRITSMQAINEFHCTRLAARVADLKKAGLAIVSERKVSESGSNYAEYRLLMGAAK